MFGNYSKHWLWWRTYPYLIKLKTSNLLVNIYLLFEFTLSTRQRAIRSSCFVKKSIATRLNGRRMCAWVWLATRLHIVRANQIQCKTTVNSQPAHDHVFWLYHLMVLANDKQIELIWIWCSFVEAHTQWISNSHKIFNVIYRIQFRTHIQWQIVLNVRRTRICMFHLSTSFSIDFTLSAFVVEVLC